MQLLRWILPPHPDKEEVADYLRVHVGQANPYIEWVVVRPDSLVGNENVSAYVTHQSQTKSALFNPYKRRPSFITKKTNEIEHDEIDTQRDDYQACEIPSDR